MGRNRRIYSLLILFSFFIIQAYGQKKPKYIFYLIGDGMGISQIYTADKYLREVENDSIAMLNFPVCGMSTTNAATRFVTGSAAAGTALATGSKTSINTVGLTTDRKDKLKSVAFTAKEQGMKVGIVTSVGLNHATPAAFYAHQKSRHDYLEIAEELPESGFDFFAGGEVIAKGAFDVHKLYKSYEKAGYKIDSTKSVFTENKQTPRVVFSPIKYGEPALSCVLDRDEGDFTLPEISEYALNQLTNDKGFFLMIEGGLIDWACHSNDAATCTFEVIDFDLVVRMALDFYNQHPDETLIVITADHETGGMSLGNNTTPYEMDISLLQYQKRSKGAFSAIIDQKTKISYEEGLELAKFYYGLGDESLGLALTTIDKDILKAGYEKQFGEVKTSSNALYSIAKPFADAVTEVFVSKTGIGFATTAHTATPVPIFSIGVGSELFDGFIDNIDIANKIRSLMEK